MRLEGNVIAGATTAAVRTEYCTDVELLGNHVGVLPDGDLLPAFDGDGGVTLFWSQGQVGDGTAAGENRVAGRDGWGLAVVGPTHEAFVRRSLFADNGGLAIDLGADGWIQPDDTQDYDSGPNGLQNRPTLVMTEDQGQTTIDVALSSLASTTFGIDLYGVVAPDPRGSGEAEVWLGQVDLATNASGVGAASAQVVLPSGITAVTATATGPDGTSELSAPACFGVCPVAVDLAASITAPAEADPDLTAWVIVNVAHEVGPAASDVVLEVDLGDCLAVEYLINSGFGSCEPTTAPRVTCTTETLEPGSVIGLQIQLGCPTGGVGEITASVRASEADPTPENDTAEASILFGAGDLSTTIASAPATLTVGDAATVEVTVAQQRAVGAASGLSAVVTLPSGLAFDDAAPGGTCAAQGAVVTCPLPAVGQGSPQTAAFTVRGVGRGSHEIVATWSGDALDADPTDDTARRVVEVEPSQAALALALSAATTWTPGDPLEITATVDNTGPDDSGAILLTWSTPGPDALVALDPRCVVGLSDVACLLDGIAPGAQATLALAVDPPSRPATVEACAVAQAAGEPACASIVRDGSPRDLATTVTGGPLEIGAAEPLLVAVANAGAEARDVTVAIDIEGARALEPAPTGCAATATGLFCEVGALAGEWSVTVPVVATEDGPVRVTAWADGAGPDGWPDDDRAVLDTHARWPLQCPDGAEVEPIASFDPGDPVAVQATGELDWVLADGALSLVGSVGGATLTLVQGGPLPPGTLAVDVGVTHAWALDAEDAGGQMSLTVDGEPVPLDARLWAGGYDVDPAPEGAPLEGPRWAGDSGGPWQSRAWLEAPDAAPTVALVAESLGGAPAWAVFGAEVFACVSEREADLAVALAAPAALALGELGAVRIDVTNDGPDPALDARVRVVASDGLAIEEVAGDGVSCEATCATTCEVTCALGDPASGDARVLTAWVRGVADADAVLSVEATARAIDADGAAATVRVPVGDAPVRLSWGAVPGSLDPWESATLALDVEDPLGRGAVAVAIAADGGEILAVDGALGCTPSLGGLTCTVVGVGPWSLAVDAVAGDGPEVALAATAGEALAEALVPVAAVDATLSLALDSLPASSATVGEPVALTLRVTPTGADPVREVIATLTGPGLSSADARCDRGGDGRLTCALGTLDAPAEVTATAIPEAPGWMLLGATAEGSAADAAVTRRLDVVGDCPPAGCDDGNPCTADACDPVLGCVHTPQFATCTDPDTCDAAGVCVEGECVAILPCVDGLACTTDACVEDACASAPAAAGSLCAGAACDEPSVCVEGACVGLWPRVCDDLDDCTSNACDDAVGCVHEALDLPECPDPCEPFEAVIVCDGLVAVWQDACGQNGEVIADCDDFDPCTVDSCADGTGCAHAPSADPTCACDGFPVTTACVAGDVAIVDACDAVAGDVGSCDDGDPCTVDSCDDALAVCVRNADPECQELGCDGAWSSTCRDDTPRWVDPCGRDAGPADSCAVRDPCALTSCAPEWGACAAEPGCLADACDTRPVTLACEDGASVARDGCGQILGALDCAEALGPTALCDEGLCVRPLDATGLPEVSAGTEPDSGDTDEPRPGACGCAAAGGGPAGWLGLLVVALLRRRGRSERPVAPAAPTDASAAPRPRGSGAGRL